MTLTKRSFASSSALSGWYWEAAAVPFWLLLFPTWASACWVSHSPSG